MHQKSKKALNGLVATWVVCLGATAVCAADPAPQAYKIEPQPVSTALKEFAAQSNMQLIFTQADVGSAKTNGVSGTKAPREALSQILKGTGLEFEFTANNVVVVRNPARTVAQAVPIKTSDPTSDPGSDSSTSKEAGKNSSRGFRLAQMDQTNAGTQVAQRQEGTGEKVGLEEIVVTAQKREERAQDVPVPVTAINAGTLVDRNQVRIQDYYTQVAGLSLSSDGARNGFPTLAIRGITTGPGTNPTVGITVDDVPYGSSTELGGGDWVPDLDPSDLARVEVLRGPQGTLYGASSLGGLLKFVTIDPSTEGFSGRLQGGTSSVYNGDGLGYNVRGSINVPVGEAFAVRASGFTRIDPGYVDDPVYHLDGVNRVIVSGGRLSGLWRPSDTFSLKVSALIQHETAAGSPNVELPPGLGDLQQSALPGTGAYDRRMRVYTANVNAKLGVADLTAVSAYSINSIVNSIDDTFSLGPDTYQQFGVRGTEVNERNKTEKFTQELRLAVPFGSNVDWLLGLFFANERSPYDDDIVAVDPVTLAQVGQWGTLSFPTTYREYAAFTDFTFHITDRFDIQVGGRESHIEQTSSAANVGVAYDRVFLDSTSPVIFPKVDTNANAFTYLVTPSFKLSPDVMVYARLASGYRAGGANADPLAPRRYSPDKTQNYELGIKGDWLDHALSADASVYYIDWKNIQIGSVDLSDDQGYDANAGGAKSKGIELTLQSRPLSGLTLGGWITLNDAVLTGGFSPTSLSYGLPGYRLPYASRISGTATVDQEIPVHENLKGFIGASVNYIGQRLGPFASPFDPSHLYLRQNFPGYAKTELRAGLRYDTWEGTLFANNVADRRAAISGGIAALNPTVFNYIQPRTVGLSVSKTF